LIGVRCAYPSPISGDAEDIFTCVSAGYWEGPDLHVCKRSGNDCGIDSLLGPYSPPVELTTCGSNFSVQACSIGADVTAQDALDQAMGGVVASCLDSAERLGTATSLTAALSVWFDGDCPTSFVVYPAEFADCVQTQLETQRFSCASGLSCGTSEVGGR
jgi:hypothetical protein